MQAFLSDVDTVVAEFKVRYVGCWDSQRIKLLRLQAVLSVLVRNFTFEFPDGAETQIVRHRGLIPRPKVAGQSGAHVPMRVRRV
jgi:hypothetical protein